jgi:hypothetical protein
MTLGIPPFTHLHSFTGEGKQNFGELKQDPRVEDLVSPAFLMSEFGLLSVEFVQQLGHPFFFPHPCGQRDNYIFKKKMSLGSGGSRLYS